VKAAVESLEVVFAETWDATFEGQDILGHYKELALSYFQRLTFPRLSVSLGLRDIGEKRLKWRTQCKWSIVGNAEPIMSS